MEYGIWYLVYGIWYTINQQVSTTTITLCNEGINNDSGLAVWHICDKQNKKIKGGGGKKEENLSD